MGLVVPRRPVRRSRAVAGANGSRDFTESDEGTAPVVMIVNETVSQRTHEFGIRMALGPSRRDVARQVAVAGLRLAVPGLVAGILVAFAAARAVGSMLVGVDAADPLTFGASALFLLAVTLLASYWPARRAVAVDPMAAVRCQQSRGLAFDGSRELGSGRPGVDTAHRLGLGDGPRQA